MAWTGRDCAPRGPLTRRSPRSSRGAKATGIAHTVRLRPSEKAVPQLKPEEYAAWANEYWYAQLYEMTPVRTSIVPGEMVVIESAGLDVGEVGSNNSLEWFAEAATGIVTTGGVRDSDECIHQQVPIFCRYRAQRMVQGHVELDTQQ